MVKQHRPVLRSSGHGRPPSARALVSAYVRYAQRVRGLSEATLNDYLSCLRRFLAAMGAVDGARPPAWLVAGRIQRFMLDYGSCHGPGARRWMQKSLRSFLSFCHNQGYTTADLSAVVPAFRSRRLASIPQALDTDRILALLHSLDRRGRSGLRDAAIIGLLTTYGVRGLHLRRLRLDDIDWEGRRIRFAAIKGGRPIEQVLTAEAGNRLLAYLKHARPAVRRAEVFLIAQPPHGPLRAASSLSSVIARRLRQAGICPPTGVSHGTHSFRHAFASRLVGQVPMKHLSDMLGHRDPDSTLIYGKVDFRALQQAALPWPEEESR